MVRGSEFQVNTYTTGNQGHLRARDTDVAVYPDGDFVVVWPSDGQDGDRLGVFGQRFHVDPTLGPLCGDVVANDLRVTSADALGALRAAVGILSCDLCICDATGSGLTTAADGLAILRFSLNAETTLACPVCEARAR